MKLNSSIVRRSLICSIDLINKGGAQAVRKSREIKLCFLAESSLCGVVIFSKESLQPSTVLGSLSAAESCKGDVVFIDGVSTAQQLTISSGRGVGLAAVRAREERGGKIRIRARHRSQG